MFQPSTLRVVSGTKLDLVKNISTSENLGKTKKQKIREKREFLLKTSF